MPYNENPQAPVDDKALIGLCCEGDVQAFEELIFRYEKKIIAAAYRLCGNRQDGEDLAQEVFVKAWRALAGYRGQASFNTWLMTILTNLWRDRLRKKQVPQESLDEVVEGKEGDMRKQFVDAGPLPEDEVERYEIHSVLDGMIQGLQPEYKEALILRDIQGFSYEEVAAITGSNLGTVKSRINRARTILKEEIMRYQEQSPGFFRLTQTEKEKTRAGKTRGGGPDEG
ncbi:MAG: sigma-70 family RNA polymerase sigma factor [Peptococcaceae bacterium]|nr:sigma-70 family RNA polymerase sigma factor [Peptococcaceae bacterium]